MRLPLVLLGILCVVAVAFANVALLRTTSNSSDRAGRLSPLLHVSSPPRPAVPVAQARPAGESGRDD